MRASHLSGEVNRDYRNEVRLRGLFLAPEFITELFALVNTKVSTTPKMEIFPTRFKPDQDLKQSLQEFVLFHQIKAEGIHLHIALADGDGKTIGGHLRDGCIIYTIAEIGIGASEKHTFLRTFDPQTGYKKLNPQLLGN